MSREIRLQALAEQDLQSAYEWYEAQRVGLGEEFLRQVDACFERLEHSPEAGPKIHRNVRRALLRRFPWCVYFTVVETDIEVLAVLHGKRNPAVWRRRM